MNNSHLPPQRRDVPPSRQSLRRTSLSGEESIDTILRKSGLNQFTLPTKDIISRITTYNFDGNLRVTVDSFKFMLTRVPSIAKFIDEFKNEIISKKNPAVNSTILLRDFFADDFVKKYSADDNRIILQKWYDDNIAQIRTKLGKWKKVITFEKKSDFPDGTFFEQMLFNDLKEGLVGTNWSVENSVVVLDDRRKMLTSMKLYYSDIIKNETDRIKKVRLTKLMNMSVTLYNKILQPGVKREVDLIIRNELGRIEAMLEVKMAVHRNPLVTIFTDYTKYTSMLKYINEASDISMQNSNLNMKTLLKDDLRIGTLEPIYIISEQSGSRMKMLIGAAETLFKSEILTHLVTSDLILQCDLQSEIIATNKNDEAHRDMSCMNYDFIINVPFHLLEQDALVTAREFVKQYMLNLPTIYSAKFDVDKLPNDGSWIKGSCNGFPQKIKKLR
jgi:hypothetical protein